MKGMILAAGLGTRLKPFTDLHPKALLKINGKSLLQRNIEYLSSYGIKDIIINVHHFPEQIKEEVSRNNGFGCNITFSDESTELLETGGGLKKAAWFFNDNDPFVVINVDVLTDMDLGAMIKQHNASKAIATIAVSNRGTSRYFLFDETGRLCGWKNEKTGEQKMSKETTKHEQKAFSGIHVISPQIFSLLKNPEPCPENENKFSITGSYLDISKIHSIMAYEHSGSKFIDVGKQDAIKRAEELFT
jgi:N-acetyl-alpha-D-muramate 1-phosphate uridylyltransferase